MISIKSLTLALFVGAVAVEGFAPKQFVSSSTTRLFAEDESPVVELPPWIGGHKESNPDFCPNAVRPDMSSEPMLKNLDNMDKITRMQKIIYPEFSWFSKIGDESSRVYTTFAQDVSRVGYDDTGKIWSLVCPQRGISMSTLGTAFLEVTVTGVRGWVDEENRSAYADISVVGKLWLQPSLNNPLVQAFATVLEEVAPGAPFPFSKENAVNVDAFQVGRPYQKEWPMVNGTDPKIFQPMSKRHYDDGAYSVYNLEVEMGEHMKKGDPLVDRFDEMLLDLFNKGGGGILLPGQRVSWNVWPAHPEGVDTEEWKGHADKWFNSMNVEHQYPDGGGSISVREIEYFDGTPYEPELELKEGIGIVQSFLEDVHAAEFLDAKKKEIIRRHPVLNFMGRHLYKKRRDHVLRK